MGSAQRAIRIANYSDDRDADWCWLRDLMGEKTVAGGRRLEWTGFSSAPERARPKIAPQSVLRRFPSVSRTASVLALMHAARKAPFDVVVSHGPWQTEGLARFSLARRHRPKHLAFSFNYTDLPNRLRARAMGIAFQAVDAFAVFTDAEKTLYTDYFGLDQSKIVRAPWGVAPPLKEPSAKSVDGEYFASLGGEARDYQTLCETARSCPGQKFVAIARPHNFDGLNPPPNLQVLFNLPPQEAWSIVYHSKAAIVPLRSRETPCGLVTVVGAMHLGKPQIVTEAAGIRDYVRHEHSGLMVPARDPKAIVDAVVKLDENPAFGAELGSKARAYATEHCSEAATLRFFEGLMEDWFGPDARSKRQDD